MAQRASPGRVIVSILLALVAPPLGLIAWIALSGTGRAEYLRSGWIRAGIIICIVSAAPLLAVSAASGIGITSDADPNPVGLGLLLLTGGVVATVIAAIGVIRVDQRHG